MSVCPVLCEVFRLEVMPLVALVTLCQCLGAIGDSVVSLAGHGSSLSIRLAPHANAVKFGDSLRGANSHKLAANVTRHSRIGADNLIAGNVVTVIRHVLHSEVRGAATGSGGYGDMDEFRHSFFPLFVLSESAYRPHAAYAAD